MPSSQFLSNLPTDSICLQKQSLPIQLPSIWVNIAFGLMINTRSMTLCLLARKINVEAHKLEALEAQALSRCLGKMNVTQEVILQAPLFCRYLQKDLGRALNESQQSCETMIRLMPRARSWDGWITTWNIGTGPPHEILEWDHHMKYWNRTTTWNIGMGPLHEILKRDHHMKYWNGNTTWNIGTGPPHEILEWDHYMKYWNGTTTLQREADVAMDSWLPE